MPYELKLYNRNPLVTVADGATETTKTSLTFVGKNFAGYGGIQNENFLYLLENFSKADPPANPVTGQIWYDSGTRKLRFYDKSYGAGDPNPTTFEKWRPVGAEIGATQPSGLTVGDFWFDTSTKQLKAYVGGETPFTLIGPQAVSGANQTSLESISVRDNANNPVSHAVVKAVVDGTTIFVISQDEFTLASSENLYNNGFTRIGQGITLVNSTTGATLSSHRFTGTATNSEKLGNLSASSYVTRNNGTFTNLATFDATGLVVNSNTASNTVKISVDTTPTIENTIGSVLSFKVKKISDQTVKNPLILDGYTVIPGAKESNEPVYFLGTSDNKWREVNAKSINAENLSVSGTVQAVSAKANELWISTAGDYFAASTSSVINSIVARDGSGNFGANVISATVTQARYADLAEKYDSDEDYEPGTVVVFGGDKEITVTDLHEDTRVAGVISTNPAYIMNSESQGLLVALRGKIPCKVIGPVQKGDILVTATHPGYAMVGNSASLPATIIGKSLENKFDPDPGVIMIVV
jgi:hypothetical protein